MSLHPFVFLLAAGLASIPTPPQGVLDNELTKAANERLAVETRSFLKELDKDPRPAAEKDEIRRKLSRVKIQVFTSLKSIDDAAAFYAGKIDGAAFLFAERQLLPDAQEVASSLGLKLDLATEKQWAGKTGRSARWRRDDGSLEIDLEEHLIDPRTAQISKKTVVMITSAE